jgi:hypothetical protein
MSTLSELVDKERHKKLQRDKEDRVVAANAMKERAEFQEAKENRKNNLIQSLKDEFKLIATARQSQLETNHAEALTNLLHRQASSKSDFDKEIDEQRKNYFHAQLAHLDVLLLEEEQKLEEAQEETARRLTESRRMQDELDKEELFQRVQEAAGHPKQPTQVKNSTPAPISTVQTPSNEPPTNPQPTNKRMIDSIQHSMTESSSRNIKRPKVQRLNDSARNNDSSPEPAAYLTKTIKRPKVELSSSLKPSSSRVVSAPLTTNHKTLEASFEANLLAFSPSENDKDYAVTWRAGLDVPSFILKFNAKSHIFEPYTGIENESRRAQQLVLNHSWNGRAFYDITSSRFEVYKQSGARLRVEFKDKHELSAFMVYFKRWFEEHVQSIEERYALAQI